VAETADLLVGGEEPVVGKDILELGDDR